jgi:hypothetical protein
MKQNKMAFAIGTLCVFVGLDATVFYYMGITAFNLSIAEAILIGLVIAGILNALALLAGKNGFAILQDDTAEAYEKKTAKKYVFFCTPIVITALVFIAYSRITVIQGNMSADPEYNILLDLLALLVPFATTVGSFCLGLSAHEPRIEDNKRKFEEADRARNQKAEERDTLRNNIRRQFDTIGAGFGEGDLMIAVQKNDSEKKMQFINAVSQQVAEGITENVHLHLQKNYRALLETIKELPLKLDQYGPAPGILVTCEPCAEWFKKATILEVIDDDFKETLNKRIQKSMAAGIGTVTRTGI